MASWLSLSPPPVAPEFTPDANQVWRALSENGALFFSELVGKVKGMLPTRVEESLAELATHGCVTSDSFEGLRVLLLPQEKRLPFNGFPRKSRHKAVLGVEQAGRWSLLRSPPPFGGGHLSPSPDLHPFGPTVPGIHAPNALARSSGSLAEGKAPADVPGADQNDLREAALEVFARTLLRRYGVVFRRLLDRESLSASWYELGRIYRRLEARGEIRGGYFVSGISGEQFALPEAIAQLRAMRKQAPGGPFVILSGADPLNLTGILAPTPRVSALASNRILLRDGVTIAALEGGEIIKMEPQNQEMDRLIERALRVGSMAPALRPYYA